MILLVFLAGLLLIPYLVFGSFFFETFWRTNWPLVVIWALIFISFNIFYFTNRQLFMLLEKEDWPALVVFLEDKVISKGNYSPRLVRLLANCFLVLSDSAAVINLENKVAISKPALINTNALVFGTARILRGDISGAVRFFDSRKGIVKPGIKEWMYWYSGFSLLLDRQFEKAAEEFTLLVQESRDSLITGLSSYFLCENLSFMLIDKMDELREIASLGRKKVLKAIPKIEAWKKEVYRFSTEIHVAVISQYIEETGRWLFQE